MATQTGTLGTIARALARLLDPLAERLEAGQVSVLLAELGLQLPASIDAHPGLAAAGRTLVAQIGGLPALVSDLVAAAEDEDPARALSAGLALANAVRSCVTAIESLVPALQAAAAGAAGIDPAELTQFAQHLPGRLLDYLVVRALEHLPGVTGVLELIGAVERTVVPGVDAAHPAFVQRSLHLDQLTGFLSDPGGHLKTRYHWGNPGFDGVALLTTLRDLLREAGLPVVLDTTAGAVLDVLVLEVTADTVANPRGLRFTIVTKYDADTAQPFQRDDWQVRLLGDATLAPGTALLVQPNDHVTLTPAAGQVTGDLGLEWTGGGDRPYVILGEPGGSRLEARKLSARAVVSLHASAGHSEGGLTLAGKVAGGKVVVSLGDADGFIGALVGGGGTLESDFEIGLGFSTKEGLFFEGSAALSVQVPLHLAIGPIDVTALTVSAGLQAGAVPVSAAVDLTGSLGPVQAVVQQIGFTATLTVPANRHGNAGPLDLAFGFKPPTGVGLSVDAGVVKGGGFLSIDTARGEYSGALQLVFADLVGLSAIGLITTRLPDGSSGFALLVIITADFGAGIQLGFGFTLNAVGGLVGVNRAMLFKPLLEGVRTGALDSIMFPHDVVANAARIISDLRRVFPPHPGTFLVGPMAKLGWGEPTLVSLSLGVVVEIPPGDIAILGLLRLALPADEIAILVLQVNFAGALEFDKQRVYFFASLFDSRILFITIEGEIGVLFAYGHDANFVVSVGGFHPQFNPPPLPFPTPKRIEVDILNTSVARIRCDGYFAVTTNTVQFGAHAELFFGFSALSVEGHIGLDALIQFSPFHFSVGISASLSVKVFGFGLFGIDLEMTLEGPTPWHAHGKASLTILFFTIGVGIDTTWGDSRETTLPPVAAMPILAGELAKRSNWRALPPRRRNLLVTLRKLDPDEAALVLHPVGTLHVSQRAIPLDLHLDKVGNAKPSDANRFELTVSDPAMHKVKDLEESFPPSEFKSLGDAAKLSQPAYVPMRGGISLGAASGDYGAGRAVTRTVRYDLSIVDTKLRRAVQPFFPYLGVLFVLLCAGASVGRSPLSARRERRTHPYDGAVAVGAERFAVANVADNRVFRPEAASFTSQVAAGDYLAQAVAEDPSLTGTLHVLPQFEVAP